MAVASELTPWEIGAYRNDMRMFDLKTRNAYWELTFQLRLRGTLPFDERFLARIAEVPIGFWRRKAWPLLCELFDVIDGRLSHSEIERAQPTTVKAVPPEISEIRRAAALAGAEKRRQEQTGQQNGQQNPANGQQNPAKVSAKSDAVAENLLGFAGDFADVCAHPPSPFLASLSSSQPTDRSVGSQEEGKGEGARAPASPDVTEPTNGQQNPANEAANGQQNPANGRAKTSRYTHLPDDWQPSVKAVDELRTGGFDPDLVVRKFRAWCKREDKRSKDHDAAFELFYLKEDRHEPAQQTHLTMAVRGGKTEVKGAYVAAEQARLAAKYRQRQGNGPDIDREERPSDDDGPIIDGVAS